METDSETQEQEFGRPRALTKKAFFEELKEGIFKPLINRVRHDKDLDLEFRGTYINIYFQGHSILKLFNTGKVQIDPEFKRNLVNLPEKLKTGDDVASFLTQLPQIKDNVVYHPRAEDDNKRISRSIELEFEQLLIRANNLEKRNNSDYIVIDRQYVVNKGKDRWDLIALRYSPKGNPRGYLSIIEVKYAQNPDIKDIKAQVERYGDYLENHFSEIRSDMTEVLNQKLDLNLIVRSPERLEWLKRLCLNKGIENTIETAEILVYLIDYNVKSKLKNLAEEKGRPKFKGKVRITYGGLALWSDNLRDFGGNDK